MTFSFRPAVPGDAEALLDAERAATLDDLAHVFPPERYPYPSDDVLARWRALLADPAVRVLVLDDGPHRIAAFVAYDDDLLRHLGVRPEHRGRGVGRAAVEQALADMTTPRLWCLTENHSALAFYARLGWRPTGREQRAEFAPYPAEVELTLTCHGPRRSSRG